MERGTDGFESRSTRPPPPKSAPLRIPAVIFLLLLSEWKVFCFRFQIFNDKHADRLVNRANKTSAERPLRPKPLKSKLN